MNPCGRPSSCAGCRAERLGAHRPVAPTGPGLKRAAMRSQGGIASTPLERRPHTTRVWPTVTAMDEVSGPRCPPILDSEDVDRVVDGLLAGRYHVILGAGASDGCENAAGKLPMAPQLAELLMRDLGVGPDPTVDLPSAYEAAVEDLGLHR